MADIFDELDGGTAVAEPDIFDSLDVEQDVPRGTADVPRATRSDARGDLTKRLQDSGLFGSATAALQGAADKGIRRKDDGNWDLPLMAPNDGGVIDAIGGLATTVGQKVGARLDDAGPAIDQKAIQQVFNDFQQANNLSDDDVAAVWSDLGNQNRTWGEDEQVRVMSDGDLLPNPNSSVWLDPEKAKGVIEAAGVSDDVKQSALAQLPQLAANLASEKLGAYEAAATATNAGRVAGSLMGFAPDRVVPPSEWAEKKGRTDVGSPQFILDYEADVKPGFAQGIAAKLVLSGNKVATQTLGTLGALGLDAAGEAAARASEGAAAVNRGLPDTGLAGAVVEEALPIGAQILTGRGFAAFGKGAAALGTFATAGAQSAGLTFAEEIAAGTPENEAREKAAKAGLSTAIITSMFGTGAGGGVERFAVGTADEVTVGQLLQKAREQGIKAATPELRKFAGAVLGSAAGEGAEEGIDQLVGVFLTADPDTSLADAWEQAAQAATVGAVLGGGIDVAMNMAQNAPAATTAAMEEPDIFDEIDPENPAVAVAPEATAAATADDDLPALTFDELAPTTSTAEEAEPALGGDPAGAVTGEGIPVDVPEEVRPEAPMGEGTSGDPAGNPDVPENLPGESAPPAATPIPLTDETGTTHPTTGGPAAVAEEVATAETSGDPAEGGTGGTVEGVPVQEVAAEDLPPGIPAETRREEQGEQDAAPLPKTKKGLIEELVGPKPTYVGGLRDHQKAISAFNKFTLDELREKVVEARESARKREEGGARMLRNARALEARGITGKDWRTQLAAIAAEHGDTGWRGMTDNSKGEEVARLASRLSDKNVDLSAVEPQEGPAPNAVGTTDVTTAKEAAYSRDSLKEAFNLDDDQATAADALVQALGLDTTAIRVKKGGVPGAGLDGTIALSQQPKRKGIKGSYEVLADGDALIRGLTNPDVSTALHELSHVARRQLLARDREIPGITPEAIEIAELWAGAKDGVWNVAAEEKFARGFEQYLREGKAPSPELATVFSRIGEWLQSIYKTIKGTSLDVKITPAMRRVLDDMVSRNAAEVGATAGSLADTGIASDLTAENQQSTLPPAPAADLNEIAPSELPAEGTPDSPTPLVEPNPPQPDFDAPYDPEAPTGLKHAIADADRERYGLPPRQVAPPTTDQASWDRALAAEQAHRAKGLDGTAGSALLDTLLASPPRALSKDEHALLLHEKLRRQQAVDATYSLLNEIPVSAERGVRENAQKAVVKAQEDFDTLLIYADAAGSASGLSLQARKMLVAQDYSLATVLNRALAAKNKHSNTPQKLTTKERQEAIELSEKLRKAQERVDALTAENREQTEIIEKLTADIEQAQERLRARDHKSRSKIKEKLDPLVEAAKARLAERGKFKYLAQGDDTTTLRSGLAPEDVQDIADLAVIGAGWLNDKWLDLAEFTTKLTRAFGDGVAAIADHVFRRSREILHETADTVEGKAAPAREDIIADIDTEQPLDRADVWALARAHVVAGLRGSKVLDAVFDDLSPVFPGLTREQVATEFTNYGRVTYPSNKEVPKELNRIRNLERIALKILDIKAGVPPKRTGFQRGEQDVEVRALEKEYRQLLKESGIQVVDPERQLQTALGAAKRRMQNEIEEIQRALDRGERRPDATAASVQFDEEAVRLKAQLEKLREDYDKTFGTGMTPEKRVEAALKMLDRQIAEEEEMARQGVVKRPDKTPLPADPRIDQRKARLKELRDARRALADAQNPAKKPKLSAEEARLHRQLASIKKRKEDLQRRMREQDFAPKAKPAPLNDPALVKARYELEKLKAAYNEMLIAHAVKNANFSKKLGYNVRSAGNLLKVTTLGGDFGVLFRNLGGATMRAIAEDAMKLLPGKVGRKARAQDSVFVGMLKQGMRSFANPEYEATMFDAIMHRPNAAFDQLFGLKFTPPFESGRVSTEDIPTANLLDKIPWWVWPAVAGVKIGLIASNPVIAAAVGLSAGKIAALLGVSTFQKPLLQALDRAQRAMTNHARATIMDAMIASIPDETLSTDDGKALAKAVMVGTGRGVARSLESFMPALQTMTLAMRFYLSRVQALCGYPLWSGPMSSDARKQIAGFYGKSVTGRAAIYTLLALAFGKADDDDPEDLGVVLNPWSKDFGKVRIEKDLVVDVGSGLQQFAGAFYRAARGGVQDKATGEIKVYKPQEKSQDMLRFLGTKRALTVGFLWDTWKGEYFGGKPTTVETALDEATSMIILNDMFQIAEQAEPHEAVMVFALMMSGGGVQVGSFETEKAKWAELRGEKEAARKEREENLNR